MKSLSKAKSLNSIIALSSTEDKTALEISKSLHAIQFVKDFLALWDLKRLQWIRIDEGRNRHGIKSQGAYGRTWYPFQSKDYRISCQVPGPFPRAVKIWQKPIYLEAVEEGCIQKNGKIWKQQFQMHVLQDQAEAIVFIGGHEAYHFLRHSRQISGRNDERHADLAGLILLECWREKQFPESAESFHQKFLKGIQL